MEDRTLIEAEINLAIGKLELISDHINSVSGHVEKLNGELVSTKAILLTILSGLQNEITDDSTARRSYGLR